MFHIYTFCDKTLVGRQQNSAKFLSEELYKLNLIISDVKVFSANYNFSKLDFKNNEVYFLLMQKASSDLNQMLAQLTGCCLKENETLKRAALNYYAKNNIIVGESTKGWTIPDNALAFANNLGEVQSYSIKVGGSEIFVLPSDAIQLKTIYRNYILGHLEDNHSKNYKSETYKTFGADEDLLLDLLNEFTKNKDNVYISVFSNGLDSDIVIKSKQDNPKFEEYNRNIYSKLEKYIYSATDLSLLDHCKKLISSQNIRLSISGDLSANYLINSLIDISGYLNECIIMPNTKSLYMYNSKEKVGSFDAKTSYDIAVKLLEKAETNICVVSFVNMSANQRGNSFIAVGNKAKIDIYKNKFMGNDEQIYSQVASACMFYLIKRLRCNDIKTIS